MKGTFAAELDSLQRTIGALENRLTLPQDDVAALSLALETLRVSEEELRQQHEELISAREAIESERARYYDLFAHAPDGYLVTNPAGIILEANEAASSLLERSQPNLNGKPLAVYLPREEVSEFRRRLAHLEGEASWEMGIKPRHSPLRTVLASVTPITETEGTIAFRWLLRDISERKHMETVLRQREGSFRLLFSNNPQPMWVFDVGNLSFLEVNEAAVQHYGYARERFLSMRLADLLSDGESSRLLGMLEGLPEGYTDFGLWRHKRADGCTIEVEARAHRLEFEGHDALMVALQDVTEERRSRAVLRASEERYRLLAENANDMISQHDADGVFSYASPAADRLFGYDPDDLTGRSVYDLFHKDDVPDLEAVHEALRHGSDLMTSEYRLRCADGDYRWVETTTRAVREGTQIAHIVAVTRDITERKANEEAFRRSEERFTKAFRASPFASAILTLDEGRFLSVNDAFVRISGYEQGEIIGKTDRSLRMWGTDAEQRAMREAFSEAGGYRDLELTLVTADGDTRTILASAEAIRVADIPCYLQMFYDITERKRSEEDLLEAINSVMQDTAWFSRQVMEKLAQLRSKDKDSSEMSDLTERERQVLQRMAQGQNNNHIARELDLSLNTIRNYVTRIYEKLGVHSRAEAIIWARERGLVGM